MYNAKTEKQITAADCKEGEKFVECGRCEKTCKNIYPIVNLTVECTTQCLPAMCICEDAKFRNSNGTCVFALECDPKFHPCGQNESLTYYAMLKGCRPSCKNLNPICSDSFVYGETCVCSKGFIRNGAGKCVEPSECFKDETSCGENESLTNCPCEPTCYNPNLICSSICGEGKTTCQCSQGFLRNYAGKCVKPTECQSVGKK
uniref:TIL domain-containing protein n=1 Tax=Panagrolaimus davidi TaxID=227884 RepID=A0A914QTR6_9BILA